MNAHPQIERPVLSWWPALHAALGDRYQHDPTGCGDEIVDLTDPFQNPEGSVAGWGDCPHAPGRLFLLRGSSAYLNLFVGAGTVLFLRQSVRGVYLVDDPSGPRPTTFEVGTAPIDVVRWIDDHVAALRSACPAIPASAPHP